MGSDDELKIVFNPVKIICLITRSNIISLLKCRLPISHYYGSQIVHLIRIRNYQILPNFLKGTDTLF